MTTPNRHFRRRGAKILSQFQAQRDRLLARGGEDVGARIARLIDNLPKDLRTFVIQALEKAELDQSPADPTTTIQVA